MEFALILSALFVLFTVFVAIITQRTVDRDEEVFKNNLQKFQELIMVEIDTAAFVEDGYSRDFTVPATFIGFDYDLEIQEEDGERYLNIELIGIDAKHFVFLERDFIGNFKKGDNHIEKKGGQILLNPIN